MIFLKSFELLSKATEESLLKKIKGKYQENIYPFGLFPTKNIQTINLQNITIFYGNNGSGKSTLLNIIAEKIKATRKQKFGNNKYFNQYVENCYSIFPEAPKEIRIITSDDVFDFLFDIRSINKEVNEIRRDLAGEYKLRRGGRIKGFYEYNEIKRRVVRYDTQSSFIRNKLNNNLNEQSNGESALIYFQNTIKENGIYLLDEPENSLSAAFQLKLMKFIEESARFFDCQFIISTHSPFLLSLRNSVIYNLDDPENVNVKWSDLPNVKAYYEFFKKHEGRF